MNTRECWLRANRRALLVGCVPAIILLLGGLWLLWRPGDGRAVVALRLAGGLLAACGATLTILLLYAARMPRVGYENGHLLLYLQAVRPVRVPVDVVECFFLGEGPSQLGTGKLADLKTANVIVRLAEKAQEWHHWEIKPAIGQWCHGYITIRGTWCEPINGKLVAQMNSRLAAVQRARRQPQTETRSHDQTCD